MKAHYDDPAVNAPLYSGANVTLLQTLAQYFEWFIAHPGTSKEAFSEVLHLQHSTLPNGNLLPDSYAAALQIIEPFLVKPVVFDACPKDCILFR